MEEQNVTSPAAGKKIHPFWRCVGFFLLIPLSSLSVVSIGGTGKGTFSCFAVGLGVLTVLYVVFRKELIPEVTVTNGAVACLLILSFTACLLITGGNPDGSLMTSVEAALCFFLYPGCWYLGLIYSSSRILMIFLPVSAVFLAFVLSLLFRRRSVRWKRAIPVLAVCALCIGTIGALYANRPAVRYAGHGFEYMHGWSSTDFSDYMVWSEPSKLATLDHPASLIIEEEKDMPRLDGAEACFPLYSAVAKAVYKDIAAIELRYQKGESLTASQKEDNITANGRIVGFTNTVCAFTRLVDGQVDLIFGARPSKNQLEFADLLKVQPKVTPIGKEAFVFFVEPDNPVTDLTSEQIRAIYHGDITNWKEVGGKNQKILAFQRPEDSGSQAMMQWFMGDVSLKEPETYEYVASMGGVLKQVAQYANEKGALGYSFRYFVEDLRQEDDVRLISVDGVLPTLENIKNGSYPLTVDLCVITRENDPNPYVRKLVDFMLSEDGQELVERSGYAGLK